MKEESKLKVFGKALVKSKLFNIAAGAGLAVLTQLLTGAEVNPNEAAVAGCEKIGCDCSKVDTTPPPRPEPVLDAGQ